MYRQEIIERYRFPQHREEMKNASVQGEVLNVLCGDELTVYILLNSDKTHVENITFGGTGCALMTASADILCDFLMKKTFKELQFFTAEDMLKLYGEMPSPSRLKCVLLPYEALHRALMGLA